MKIICIEILFIFIILTSEGCAEGKTIQNAYQAQIEYHLESLEIPLIKNIETEHFRGLDINEGIACIAGSKGTTIQYSFENSGLGPLQDSLGAQLHFRDAHSDLRYNMYMSIQKPSQLIKMHFDTTIIVFQNLDTSCFIDGIDFWSNGHGLLFGDPIQEEHFMFRTEDEGNTWRKITKTPSPIKNEAGFAASGTSVVCVGAGIGYIGWGGDEVRVFKTKDYGVNWEVQTTPMPTKQSGTGIYSMAFKDELNGVAVGGNWEFADCDSSKIYTKDGGDTWHLSNGIQGYRSCVTHVKENIYVSTGTNGTDISYNGGETWQLLDTIGFNAIQFNRGESDNIQGIGVGNYGLIKLLQLK